MTCQRRMSRARTCWAVSLLVAALVVPVQAVDVWTANTMVAVFEGPDYSGRNDPNCAIQIVGALNGAFSGQVVLSDKAAFDGPAAQASDLKTADGKATIPAQAVQVRYALPTGAERGLNKRFATDKNAGKYKRFEALSATPQPQATVHPIWVTVNIPAQALPGDYRGALSIKVADRSIDVPVRLKVCPWTLPDPKDYLTHVGLIQSPDSVAIQYKAPLFSDKHFELMAKSMDLLGQVGNKVIFIPMIAQTHFGNEQSMVRFIKQGNSWKPDFTIFDKYFDLYEKHVARPSVVCLYAWETYTGGSYFNKYDNPEGGNLGKPVPVSEVDPAGGEVKTVETFRYGTAEAEALWKPVYDEIRTRLNHRGIGDASLTIGIAGDTRPSKEVVAFFTKVAPYARWTVHSHSGTGSLYGVPVGYLSHVWGVGRAPKPPDQRNYGWRLTGAVTVFPRWGGGGSLGDPALYVDSPLGTYHTLAETCLVWNVRGFGRVGADFWPVIDGGKAGMRDVISRYPISAHWAQLGLGTATARVIAPGPDGAISTTRFENLREGIEEAEARIFIEKALAANLPAPPPDAGFRKPKNPPATQPADATPAAPSPLPAAYPVAASALPKDQIDRLQALLDERVQVWLAANRGREPKGPEWLAAESGWQARNEKLFNAAGELARQSGSPAPQTLGSTR